MSNFDRQKDYWKPCRPGTILKAVDSKLQRERRRFLVRSAMGVVVGGVGIFSAFFISANSSRRRLAKLENQERLDVAVAGNRGGETTLVPELDEPKKFTCNDIKSNLAEYVLAYRLPGKQRSKIQTGLILNYAKHLEVCDKCLPLVNDALSRDVIS